MKLQAVIGSPARGVKRLTSMVFRKTAVRFFGLPRSGRDYLSAVGDGTGSSTVMAPLLWILRAFPEAPPALYQTLDDGQEEQLADHEMLRLLRRPNKHFSGRVLWMATVADWIVDGNAYWLKIRDRGGRVRELWWAPRWMIEPKGTETEFITHYEYRVRAGDPLLLSVDDVVHFRFGADGDNPRKGFSPLKSVLREVFTDDEAANFTASLLTNMGVPGLVVSPEKDSVLNPGDADETKAYIKAMFTGDRRGEAMVMSAPTKVEQFGFSPDDLNLKDLRRVPEERVSGVLGVAAVVAGLGAGLDRSTFGNYSEAREASYEQAVLPAYALLGEEVWFQLLPDFEATDAIWSWRVGFDLANVRVLQEDRLNLAKRQDMAVRGGWATVAAAKRAVGEKVLPGDDIYIREMNRVAVPAGGGPAVHYTPPKQPAGTNGHAALDPEDLREVVR